MPTRRPRKPPADTLSQRVNLFLSAAQMHRLQTRAQIERRSLPNLIRYLLDETLSRDGKGKR